MKIVVIGAGIGGLSAAVRLASAGHRVTILEARTEAGGLAGSVEIDGHHFDAGPPSARTSICSHRRRRGNASG